MNKIKINVKAIRNNLEKISGVVQFVMKSNAYGFGNEIISYVEDLIDSVVTTDYNEYLLIKKKMKRNLRILLLYEDDVEVLNKDINIYICVNNLKMLNKIDNYERCYMRIDPYLGLHGFDEIQDNVCFDKFLLHLNEYLEPSELKVFNSILYFIQKNNFSISIGGSAFLDVKENMFATDLIEMRIARSILIQDKKSKLSNFILEVHVINQKILNGDTISIGYKSSRENFKSGTIILISLGYGDFGLLSLMYIKGIGVTLQNEKFKIPVYPCMNTCWLYSDKLIQVEDKLELFKSIYEIEEICRKLEIDIDEFYASFNSKYNARIL